MNILTSLSQLKGETVKMAVIDDGSVLAMTFYDGGVAIIKAFYFSSVGVELEFATTLDCLSDDTQLKLGIIDNAEYDRRRMEWDRRLAEQVERNERETLARLKAKYEG